jgi:hypothetical protein
MSGNWIKMRSEVLRSPKLVEISRTLIRNQNFRDWLFPDNTSDITESALRCVTCALLLRVWSDARNFGDFIGEDLYVPHLSIPDIDLWAEAPGVGKAMEKVGWVNVGYSEQNIPNGLVFLNFKQYNTPKDDAEKQRDYRKRQKAKGSENVTGTLPSVGNAALPLEEKRIEENIINTPIVPKGTLSNDVYSEDFERFWKIFPSTRRVGKGVAWRSWKVAIKTAKAEGILAAAKEFSDSPLGRSRFCPGPSPWLNQKRWLDCRDAWQRGDDDNQQSPAEPVRYMDDPLMRHAHEN